nr:IS21 family transposase [Ornithinimicrobium ciconiae]
MDPKTVRRYVAARDSGAPVTGPGRRPRIIDEHLPKIEEWVERSSGKARADVIHARLLGLGFTGTERTTRRAVAEAKAAWRAGNRRTYRPWISEPGLWLQFDWGQGPRVAGPDGKLRATLLFCAWVAWSRFRVVIPTWDQTLPSLVACLDATLRTIGGVPAYVLTDNAKTVTIDHVAGVPVCHPELVKVARHYGTTVHTCVPFDPESKGGTEATVKIAKADLVPTEANLGEQYASFSELEAACGEFMAKVNGRKHRESARIPEQALAVERSRLHTLPSAPHTMALGLARTVGTDQTIRYNSVRYSTPPGWSVPRCGSASPGPSSSSSLTWPRYRSPRPGRTGGPGWSRSPGTPPPPRATLGSSLLTTRTIPRSRTAHPGHPSPGHAPTPRPRSWPWAMVPARGWSRPPRPGPCGSGPRWLMRSSSRP